MDTSRLRKFSTPQPRWNQTVFLYVALPQLYHVRLLFPLQ